MSSDDLHVPAFRFACARANKSLILVTSAEANAVASDNRRTKTIKAAKSVEIVEKVARAACRGIITDELLLANSQLQFGKYRNQTFRWVLENDVGWSVNVVTSVEKETDTGSSNPLNVSKRKFVQYVRLFPAMVKELRFREMCDAALTRERSTADQGEQLLEFGMYRASSWWQLYESADAEERRYVDIFILPKTDCIPGTMMTEFHHYCLNRRAGTTTTAAKTDTSTTTAAAATTTTTTTATVSAVDSDSDEVILAAVTKLEREGVVNALNYLL